MSIQSPGHSLRVHLLGTMAVSRDGERLRLPPSQKARALLAYLILNRERPHARTVVVGEFWGDLPENRARRGLSQALWHINRVIPDLVSADSDEIGIATDDLWVDVDLFCRLIEPGASQLLGTSADGEIVGDASTLRAAVDLYRGDLLEAFDEYWVVVERERLRDAYVTALSTLLSLEKAASNYRQALELALRLGQVDPLREETHREIMRLYVLLDRAGEALKHFDMVLHLIDDELGVDPEPETMALAETIADRSGKAALPYLPVPTTTRKRLGFTSSTPLRLIGRDDERREILGHLEQTFRGQSGVLLVSGDAGVGKTRLLQEVARDADWRGIHTLWGRCDDTEVMPPYHPWDVAISEGMSPLRLQQLQKVVPSFSLSLLAPVITALRQYIDQDSPGRGLTPTEQRDRLCDAFVQLLTAWSRMGPLLIILENVHRADDDTLSLLPELSHRLANQTGARHGILLVATYRMADARGRGSCWERLTAIDRAPISRRVDVAPLGLAATTVFIGVALKANELPEEFVQRLFTETNGNPLFVLETLRSLQDSGQITQRDDGSWELPDVAGDSEPWVLPQAVERAIATRLERLDEGMRGALRLATVLGSEFNFALFSEVSDLDPQVALTAMQHLRQSHFLEESPDAYRFSHAKIREVAYAEIPDDERIALHRRAARTLEAKQMRSMEALAHHFLLAQVWDKAIEYGIQAAEHARRLHAHEAAVCHYDRALAILAERQPFPSHRARRLRFETLVSLQYLLWISGARERQGRMVAELLLAAEQLGDGVSRCEALKQQAYYLCYVGDDYAAVPDVVRAMIGLARAQDLPEYEGKGHHILGDAHKFCDRLDDAMASFERAITIWQTRAPSPRRVAEALVELASVNWRTGHLDQASAYCEEGLAVASSTDDALVLSRLLNMRGIISGIRGEFLRARDDLEASLGYARRIGYRRNESALLANLGINHWAHQEYDEALTLLTEGLHLRRQLANAAGILAIAQVVAALYIELGQFELSEALLAECEALVAGTEQSPASLTNATLRVLLELERGGLRRGQGAVGHLKPLLERVQRPDCVSDGQFVLGRVHLAQGKSAGAASLFETALTTFVTAGREARATLARAYRAVALSQSGRGDEAESEALRAVSELAARGYGDTPQVVHLCAAQVLFSRGRLKAALNQLSIADKKLQSQRARLPRSVDAERFLYNVQGNREIGALVAQHRDQNVGSQITLSLPRATAPKGRALTVEDTLSVTWTVASEADDLIESKVGRRRQQLRRLLAEAEAAGASATYQHLADALGVSLRTIERDMADLNHDLT